MEWIDGGCPGSRPSLRVWDKPASRLPPAAGHPCSPARSFFLIDRPTQGKWELGIGASPRGSPAADRLQSIPYRINIQSMSGRPRPRNGRGLEDQGNASQHADPLLPRPCSWFGQPVRPRFAGTHGRLLGGKGSRLAGPNLRYYLTKLAPAGLSA